ncbi:hypothetical protein FRC00_001248 [Tulasnella sp. 408]|nr:hypothetical protein FRC00_001248 [Tulasnella sp. 408]
MDILSTSPHLEYLELDNIPDLSPPETHNSTIHLDALNAIVLQGLNPLAVAFILSTIRVPRCRSLTIRCGLRSGVSAQKLLTPDLAHLHSAIQDMARTAKFIEIDRYGTGRQILTVGDFKFILESEEADQLWEAFRWLTLALGSGGPTLGVRLALDDRGPGSFYLEPQFSSRITELELFGPSKGKMDPTQWALRQLEAIDIRLGIECMGELVEMLVARYGSIDALDLNSMAELSKGVPRPSPLAEIHFWYIPNSAAKEHQQKRWFMQVRKAAPTTKIFWAGELQQFDEDH